MSYPSFNSGDVLTATDMNAVGLWLVKSQAVGSGVSSVTVTGAFSTNYDSYRIVYQGGTTSGTASIRFQLGGITGSVYQQYGYYGNYGTGTLNGYGPAAATLWTDLSPATSDGYAWHFDLHNPFLSVRKFGRVFASSTTGVHELALYCDSTTSATEFTVSPSAGTMTGGTLRVYGYQK